MSSQFRAPSDSLPLPADAAAPAGPSLRAHTDDLDLAERVLRREPVALSAFLQRMQCVPRFLVVRNQRLGSMLGREELEDVAQDALVAIWRKLGDYRGEAKLETWALQFCEFDLRNARRRAAIRRGRPIDEVPEPGSEAAAGADDLEAVYQAMRGLTPDEAAVVRMKHFEQLTFDEIGTRFGGSSNTAKARYYRALERIRGDLRRRELET